MIIRGNNGIEVKFESLDTGDIFAFIDKPDAIPHKDGYEREDLFMMVYSGEDDPSNSDYQVFHPKYVAFSTGRIYNIINDKDDERHNYYSRVYIYDCSYDFEVDEEYVDPDEMMEDMMYE